MVVTVVEGHGDDTGTPEHEWEDWSAGLLRLDRCDVHNVQSLPWERSRTIMNATWHQ